VNLTEAIYDRLVADSDLADMLAEYDNGPAIFTTDPAPANAVLPYIVSAGHVAVSAHDTKTTRGRQIWRDVRCYAPASGSALVIESIAERVRNLLHRHNLQISNGETWVAEASGPIAADEEDAYGRIVTIRLIIMEV